MKKDLDLIKLKIKSIKKLPEGNPKEYNLKQDLLRHWQFEKKKLQLSIEYDINYLKRQLNEHPAQPNFKHRKSSSTLF